MKYSCDRLDQGSMAVWKNDVRLGVMQAEGLSGPLYWAVVMSRSDSVRIAIESAPLPNEPTPDPRQLSACGRRSGACSACVRTVSTMTREITC